MSLIKLVLVVLIIIIIAIIFVLTFLDVLKEQRKNFAVEQDFLKDFNEYVAQELIKEAKAPEVNEASTKELKEAQKLVKETLEQKKEPEEVITELRYVSDRREKDQAQKALKDIKQELEKTLELDVITEDKISFKDKVDSLDKREVEHVSFDTEEKDEKKLDKDPETIISMKEFDDKGEKLYKKNEMSQYELDETIPISIDELYDTMSIPVIDDDFIENLKVEDAALKIRNSKLVNKKNEKKKSL